MLNDILNNTDFFNEVIDNNECIDIFDVKPTNIQYENSFNRNNLKGTYNKYSHHIPQILQDMSHDLCENYDFIPNRTEKDPRTASTLDENVVIDYLKINFGKYIYVPNIRHWYDLWLLDEELPVNIKITRFKNAINACNFKACVYALTDLDIDMHSTADARIDSTTLNDYWNENYIHINQIDITRDYYMFVINKDNPKDIIINSLRGTVNLTPNANNLPFQISFSNKEFLYNGKVYTNRDYCPKTLKDAYNHYRLVMKKNYEKDFIIKTYIDNDKLLEKYPI